MAAGGSYDVIVVGLGGMGGAAAYHLARRGRRVLGLDRFAPAHQLGSSHGGTRLIRQVCFEDPAYVPLIRRAYDLWNELERDSGETLFLRTGGLLLGPPDCTMVADGRAVADECSIPYELLGAAEIRKRWPLVPDDDTVALFEPGAGVIRPEQTVAAHQRLAGAAGADLHFEEPVVDWSAGAEGGVEVVTAKATYHAERLVLCPGAWAPELLGDVGVPFAPQRLVVIWFQAEGGVTPFLPDRYPFWLWDMGGRTHRLGFSGFLYGAPSVDGPDGGVKLSRCDEEPCTADTVNREVSSDELHAVAESIRPRLAVGLGPPVKASVCMWTNTPDHHFVLAPHPDHAAVIVAAGCSGHAFKFLPTIGEILADLVIDGKTAHSTALFTAHGARSSAGS